MDVVLYSQVASAKQEARVKVILEGLIAVVFVLSFCYIVAFDARIIIFGTHSDDDEKWRSVIYCANNSCLCICSVVIFISIRRWGVLTKFKSAFILFLLCWSGVEFVNSWNSAIFHFTTLCLDLTIFIGTHRDAIIMDRMALLVLAWFMFAVTLDHIDWYLKGDLGIHLWGRKECNDNLLNSYLYLVVPTIVNFLFVRRYVRGARTREHLAMRSVEVAYGIADKLANYALDDAEIILRSNDLLHDVVIDIRKPFSHLLENLKCYQAFLPNALFEKNFSHECTLDIDKDLFPNAALCSAMSGKETSFSHLRAAVNRLHDRDYTLESFHRDMVTAFPELTLYSHSDEKTTSGRSGTEEYTRTLGAFYAVYSLLRLDIDGKEVFSFGVDEKGRPRAEPVGEGAPKKKLFYESMPWNSATELLIRAGLLTLDDAKKISLRKDRVAAMLTLTAMHDVMKNTALLPTVHPRHAPYRGYHVNERIQDHDVALEYVLEHFPTLLPSFKALEPKQRAPVLFTQGKMGFNNGWLVQGEAPPSALFTRFKQVIMEGRASKTDVNFYFVHWLTDLAGAEVFNDGAWPGAEKFTLKFPVKVLSAFLESFGFVDRLAVATEVNVMEDYLLSRWRSLGLKDKSLLQNEVGAMRLALMAQGFETELVHALEKLCLEDRETLFEELARTGCREQFRHAPASLQMKPAGPAMLIYYSPALLQKAGGEHCAEALHVLACVFRAARKLFPLVEWHAEQTVTIRIDEMKVYNPVQITYKSPWYLKRTSGVDAEAVRGIPPDDSGALITFASCTNGGKELEL